MLENKLTAGCDEDDEYKKIRFEKLKYYPQKELFCNRYLPYADSLDEESEKMFQLIKMNLCKGISLRDVNPGVVICCNRLLLYIKLYGLKFSKEDHILLVKIFIELITLPSLDPSRLNLFCSILLKLLKRKLIAPSDLQIEWRPLYKLYTIYLDKSSNKGNFYQFISSLLITLKSVFMKCSNYFPKSSINEVLSEIFPKLQPLDVGKSCQEFEVILLFLNVNEGYEIWLDDFMNLWNTYHNPPWSEDMMNIVSNVAFENIGDINWEPYLPVMFSRILKSIDLPVCYKKLKLSKNINFNVISVSKWIVAVLGPGKSGQKYLKTFIRSIETYLHPANLGKWLTILGQLLGTITELFIKRLEIERFSKPTWKKQIKDSEKLTEKCITDFVLCFKPAALQAMYSRIDSNDVFKIFKHLSDLRPELIIPEVIEIVYNNLDSLTEPHRLTASFQCLVGVSRALVCGQEGYTAGKVDVIPILFAALPGIDPNDLRKAFLTMNFYGAFLLQIPIVDSSKLGSYFPDLTEEETLISEQTAEFENFVLQFIDRILVMIKFITQENIRMEQINNMDIKSRHDLAVENSISSVLQVILGQCSQEINEAGAKKISDFVQSNLLDPSTAAPLLGILVYSVGRNAGGHIYKILMPFLTEKIMNYLNEHQDAELLDKQENDFLYFLTIFCYLFKSDPREIVKYLDDSFFPIMDSVLNFKCQLTAKLSSGLLLSVLSNLTKLQIFSIPSNTNGEELKLKIHPIRQWGAKMEFNEPLNWFIPGNLERDICEKIIHRYLPPILKKFDQYINGEIEMCREDTLNNCNIILALISLCNYLPNWEEPLITFYDTIVDLKINTEIILGMEGNNITMPNGENVRLTVLETISKLYNKIIKDSSDYIQTLKSIVTILDRIHLRKGYLSSSENELKSYYSIKKFQNFKLIKRKSDIKAIVIKRALIQQARRDELSQPNFTNSHATIMNILLNLSTSHYSAVRIVAQLRLLCMINKYPYSYNAFIDDLIEIINLDANENHEKFKGALFLLIGSTRPKLIIKNDLLIVEKVWLNLLKSTPSEKPSIVQLMDTLSSIISKEFSTSSIIQEMTDEAISLARQLCNIDYSVEEIQNSKERLEKKNKFNTELYLRIINSIISIAEKDLTHWRHHLLASKMIDTLVHPLVKYPTCVTKFFLENLLNDSIKERKISINILISVFEQNKRKHIKINIDPFEIAAVEKPSGKLTYGMRNDNQWLQYDLESLPKNQLMWDKPIYIHKTDGYFGWSSNLKVHAPTALQPNIDRTRDELEDNERLFYDFFSNKDKVDKYIEYASLEENKGKEKFKQPRFALIKYIFQTFGDTFYPNFQDHLKQLILKNTVESNHRCASEILSGIIRSMKHWPYDKVEKMYTSLKPLIKLVLENITVETDVFWGTCFATASENVDPRKQYWIYEILIDNLLSDCTSFTGCCKIFCLQGPFNQHVWRMDSFAHRLLHDLKPFLSHPFQNVRARLGSILINIFEADIQFPGGNKPLCPSVNDMIDEILPELAPLQEVIDEFSEIESEKKNSPEQNLSLEKQEEKDKAIRLFKTICQWIIGIISRKSNGNELPYFKLLSFACYFESCEQDAELGDTCKTYLAVISQALTLPDCFDYALNKITEISLSKSWNTRLAVIDCLQVLIFHNMAIASCNKQWVIQIENIVLRFLEDPSIEVQEKASQVLGGLIHCTFIPDEQKLLKLFKIKCKTKLGNELQKNNNNRSTNAPKNGLHDLTFIRIRHAGILGLCSFISAHPYEIPDYLPGIFDELANHINDPQPISSTIRKTVGDFKRTHSDNWSTHKLKFTDNQLDLLNDLTIPPSYYT